MPKKLLANDKLRLLRKAKAGKSIFELCREFGISRALFYRIRAQNRKGLVSKKRFDSRRVPLRHQELILNLVRSHPEFSSQKISEKLPRGKNGRSVVGNHGVQNVLRRLGLSTYIRRLEFANKNRHIPLKKKLSAIERLLLIRKVEKGTKISEVCRQYGISRTLFYRLFARYKAVSEQEKLSALKNQPPIPKYPWRLTPPDVVNKVLELVATNPELSVHKLVDALPQVAGRPILSNKGVQNVLRRNHLSTYEQRLVYSRLTEEAWEPRFTLTDIPYIPLKIWRMLYAPFATIPKLGWLFTRGQLLLIFILLLGFYFYKIIGAIIKSPAGTPVGTFFAAISLTFGLFFFIYSLKYYLTILLVLRLAQSGGSQTTDNLQLTTDKKQSQTSDVSGQLLKFFSKLGISLPQRQGVNPLLVNLEKVELTERPFVSIHVAVYNETKVIERLIQACCSQKWEVGSGNVDEEVGSGKNNPASNLQLPTSNYEVVIVDDSTDETLQLALQQLTADPSTSSGQARQLTKTFSDEEQEIYLSTPNVTSATSEVGSDSSEVFSGPVVKLIHRFSRAGFKGGALQTALENTDPRAKYVVVFDSDFVPYPDTIEQFVKTFQVLQSGQASSGNGNEARIVRSEAVTLEDEKRQTLNETSIVTDNRNTNIAAVQGYQSSFAKASEDKVAPAESRIAAVQGYQWHVLNKSENWITRGVRTEYAGSYVIERASEEIYGGLKQIAGSVYAIRADVLRQFGWGTSITEDFELTLRLYEAGYKVAFTPYIQAPAEAVSTVRRLIRQRMRWAEGASFNVKCMFGRMLFGRWMENTSSGNGNEARIVRGEAVTLEDEKRQTLNETGIVTDNRNPIPNSRIWLPSKLTLAEKLEFLYLAPYYLQAALFVVGTLSWFISEAILHARLPFWTAALGWSLVFTNLLSLPLMNIVGLFLEESDERDYVGILSFIALSYVVVPFQAYAAIKGFLERQEGPWFRTPKTGLITDIFGRSRFKFFGSWFGRPASPANLGRPAAAPVIGAYLSTLKLAPVSAYNKFENFKPIKKRARLISRVALFSLVGLVSLLLVFSRMVPIAYASPDTFFLDPTASGVITAVTAGKLNTGSIAAENTNTCVRPAKNVTGFYEFLSSFASLSCNTSSETESSHSPDSRGLINDTAYGSGVTIPSGTWTFRYSVTSVSACSAGVAKMHMNVYKVSIASGQIGSSTFLFHQESSTDMWTGADFEETVTVSPNPSQVAFDDSQKYLYVEFFANVTTGCSDTTAGNRNIRLDIGTSGCSTTDCNVTSPTVSIPEAIGILVFTAPVVPVIVAKYVKRRGKVYVKRR